MQAVTSVKWPKKGVRCSAGLAGNVVFQEMAHRGAGRQEREHGSMLGGWCLPGPPGDAVPNPELSAFPPQGEKGAAGSPGLLGLLGQKVGLGKL